MKGFACKQIDNPCKIKASNLAQLKCVRILTMNLENEIMEVLQKLELCVKCVSFVTGKLTDFQGKTPCCIITKTSVVYDDTWNSCDSDFVMHVMANAIL